MALPTRISDREIHFKNWIEQIEHITGKTVLSWRDDFATVNLIVLFTDKTYCKIHPYESFDVKNLKFERIPESYCASCGKDAHVSFFNWKGWCEVTNKQFWKKARKVYWHRYIKNK